MWNGYAVNALLEGNGGSDFVVGSDDTIKMLDTQFRTRAHRIDILGCIGRFDLGADELKCAFGISLGSGDLLDGRDSQCRDGGGKTQCCEELHGRDLKKGI